MESSKKTKSSLDSKLKKIQLTQAGFDFYVAIHSFVKFVESNPELPKSLRKDVKLNRELNIASKYDYLKQVYQGIEDVNVRSNVDLGHARYATIKDLNKIRSNELSENNTLWKKRELLRKTVGEVHTILSTYLTKFD
ncbi:MAG: hypothetical protein Q8L47_02150 [bacterium]|nr:hypothetical protein [bacterium]